MLSCRTEAAPRWRAAPNDLEKLSLSFILEQQPVTIRVLHMKVSRKNANNWLFGGQGGYKGHEGDVLAQRCHLLLLQ